jgi:cellobiose phosphorylase
MLVGMSVMSRDQASLGNASLDLHSTSGLVVEAAPHGGLTAFENRSEEGTTSLLLFPGGSAEAGPANVHLRQQDAATGSWRHCPLLGPLSPSVLDVVDDALVAQGTWEGLAYRLLLRLSDEISAWRWDLTIARDDRAGETDAVVRVDVVVTHDPALASPEAVRTNEYYVSQYLDLSPVATPVNGTAIAVRQNMPGPSSPWLLVGSVRRGTGWATDAHQLVERTIAGTVWTGLSRDLPSARLQHEHALLALQDEAVDLAPGESHTTGFVGLLLADHPAATGPDDVRHLETALAALPAPDAATLHPVVPPTAAMAAEKQSVAHTLATAPALECRALTELETADLGLASTVGWVETDTTGAWTAWQCARGEVVTQAKELAVLRPHGQLLRTGDSLEPDPGALTSTVWMGGVFHSQVTRGHVGREPLLSGRRSYLGLFRSHGLRLLVDTGAGWRMLETPSAWCIGLDAAWWWYATDDGLLLEVTSRAPAANHELTLEVRVLAGDAPLVRATAHLDQDARVDDWTVDAFGTQGGVGSAATQDDAWLVLDPSDVDAEGWTLRIGSAADHTDKEPDPSTSPGDSFWPSVTGSLVLEPAAGSPDAGEVASLAAAAPWFAHDALVHYLSPRGLEQFSGGGWGTRDVCQGPVGLLTALDRHDVVRDVLLRILRAQNARGDWAQAFEFVTPSPGADHHGQQDSHGDVVFWPLLAVGEHLQTTGDASLLEEKVPFVGDEGPTEPATVEEHLRAAVGRIQAMAVPGTALPAYGHGDWNDSLQPADPALARDLASVWTAVLQVQALDALAEGLAAAGADGDLADTASTMALRTRAEIGETALTDGVLPGYLLFAGDAASPEPLVHPRDERTGLTYGVLPWIHAIAADVLSPEDSAHHLDLIQRHLLGPDGARLFDQPVAYRGGPMEVFQRAEASTFWGREIGLMYMHAHLRYAEALARVGDGTGLLHALAQVSPWGLSDRVPQSRPRQRSCYYSSSDGAFADRDDASARYADLMAGEVPLEGGWRVYSSGPGLALRLVVERLLGVRRRAGLVEIDPVLPTTCDGLAAVVRVGGHQARIQYAVGPEGVGVRRVQAGGQELELTALTNPHRRAGVAVRTDDLVAALAAGHDLHVETF